MWGRPIIARILLRRELGREPTEAEVKVQITKLDGGSSPLPPLGVITAAFERGEEVHPVFVTNNPKPFC